MKRLTLLLALAVSATAWAELPVVTYDVTINQSTEATQQEYTEPGASFVRIHFTGFYAPPGAFVRVRNPEGTEFYDYPAGPRTVGPNDDGKTSFRAMSISGDTAIVENHGARVQVCDEAGCSNTVTLNF